MRVLVNLWALYERIWYRRVYNICLSELVSLKTCLEKENVFLFICLFPSRLLGTSTWVNTTYYSILNALELVLTDYLPPRLRLCSKAGLWLRASPYSIWKNKPIKWCREFHLVFLKAFANGHFTWSHPILRLPNRGFHSIIRSLHRLIWPDWYQFSLLIL